MKKKLPLSYSIIKKTRSLNFSRHELYQELVDTARQHDEDSKKRSDEFTRRDFMRDSGVTGSVADRILGKKIKTGEVSKRNAPGNNVYFRFVEAEK